MCLGVKKKKERRIKGNTFPYPRVNGERLGEEEFGHSLNYPVNQTINDAPNLG